MRLVLYVLLAASLALSVRALFFTAPPIWVASLLLALLLVVLLVGALTPRFEVYGDVLTKVPEAHGLVALTFDDGPDARSTARVLDILAAREARATFFVLGSRAAEHPELIARMSREGHSVGIHSFGHQRGYAFLSPGAVQRDIEACQQIVMDAGAPRPLWFRPPVGQTSPRTFRGAERASVEVVAWSVRGLDGLRRTTAAECVARIREGLRDGAIVLLHDAWERPGPEGEEPPAGVRSLEEILDLCEQRGLRPVCLDELVSGSGYQLSGR